MTAIADALDVTSARARVLVSSIIVAQMLPANTVVKGGIGVKLRLGEVGTRATRDVDVVACDREQFLAELAERLETGWGTVPPSRGALKKDAQAPPRLAFSGKVRPGKQARPDSVPPAYLMEPYNVTLHFMGSPWAAVPLEAAHDEIGGIEHAESSPEVDGRQGLDLPLLAQLCQRTFDYRHTHDWPPASALPGLLDPAYQTARDEVGPDVELAPTLADATAWLAERIAETAATTPRPR